jgi:O-antigen/teichoic acid export membrane protein
MTDLMSNANRWFTSAGPKQALLRTNVVANYIGQATRALIGLAFIPLYIKYLGIEAYGLIGIYAVLQTWLAMLDVGMKPALGREMARFAGGAHSAQSIRDLLRTIEIMGIAIATAIAIGIWAVSGWLASEWLTAKSFPVEVVAQAFAIMGLVTALRFVEDIYSSSMAGLQRQALQTMVSAIIAVVQALGAVGVLAWISPTINAFFLWQGLISLITVAVFGGLVYRVLPSCPRAARFSWQAVTATWRFAAGMLAITFLALLLTQVDKILLSRLLTLEAFAYYALAGVMANTLYMLAGPITTAFLPRFTELATRGDEVGLCSAYHQAAQLVTVSMGTAAIVLILFGTKVIRLWTGDAALAEQVAPLVAVLAVGTLLNGLMWIPYHMQLAHGWTTLAIKVNVIAVCVLVPAILWVVPTYGAIGAAWIWVILNLSYVLFAVQFMHLRLLRNEKWRWYSQDVAIPLGAAVIVALLCRWVAPEGQGKLSELGVLVVSSGCILVVATLAAPALRHRLSQYIFGGINSR